MGSITKRDFLKKMMYLAVSALGLAGAGKGIHHLLSVPDGRSMRMKRPSYLRLKERGELRKRGLALMKRLEACDLCPRNCGVNRFNGEKGVCQASSDLEISSFHPHFGEEPPLVGQHGSGTIFLTNCGLRCVFCINYTVSHLGQGRVAGIDDMARMMLTLQQKGCHNINVVTPTHYAPHILLALDQAAAQGLRVPLVYNTCGWEKLDVLALLDGVVDIYLPDFKYWDGDMAARYSAGAFTYPDIATQALKEMHRQVGRARIAPDGTVYKGLMIRHLVMPNQVGGSKQILRWIAEELPKDTYINIMSQYRPMYKAFDHKPIARRITREEFETVVDEAKRLGFTNLEIQTLI
jgi:putative pyruvate formate lyase activating enzyme